MALGAGPPSSAEPSPRGARAILVSVLLPPAFPLARMCFPGLVAALEVVPVLPVQAQM